MHHHLVLIETGRRGIDHNQHSDSSGASDMEIILTQALLLEAGGATFRAIKSGQIADILAGLVNLAYTALQAFSTTKQELTDNLGEGYQAYQMLVIMRLLSEKIHQCSSGEADSYANLYHVCANLASGFLNADFDKAFQVYHAWQKKSGNPGECGNWVPKPDRFSLPDLTDCLYE